MDDGIVDSAIGFPSRRNNWTTELFTSFVERLLHLRLVPSLDRTQDSAERGFGSIQLGDVECIFDGVPISDEQ